MLGTRKELMRLEQNYYSANKAVIIHGGIIFATLFRTRGVVTIKVDIPATIKQTEQITEIARNWK